MGLITDKYSQQIGVILQRYKDKQSAILPVMHLAQQVYGYMSPEAEQEVAQILDLDPTPVLSLAGFYSLYYEEPVGQYVLEICHDLACALRGADEFLAMVCAKLGIEPEGTTADGLFSVKAVMCIGACDRAPALQCNLKFHENLDEAKFDALLAEWRAEAAQGNGGPSVVDKAIAGYARD